MSVVDRQRPLRHTARRAAELPGPAPAGGPISCADKKWGKEAAGGCAPLTPALPPVGLRPKSAAPCHGSMGGCAASRSPPRRGRNAPARESPEPYRGCFWGGTATGRKTTPVPGVRALCARARRSRTVFRPTLRATPRYIKGAASRRLLYASSALSLDLHSSSASRSASRSLRVWSATSRSYMSSDSAASLAAFSMMRYIF